MNLSVLPVIRNNLNQRECDIAIAPNGLGCAAYSEVNELASGNVYYDKYVIFDATTGQNIVAPTIIPLVSGTDQNITRVFTLGSYFILLTIYVTGGSTFNLQYIAIPYATPSSPGSPTSLATGINGAPQSVDAYVAGGNLYYAYYKSSGVIDVNYLTSALVNNSPVSITGDADLMSVCADITGSSPVVYLNYYNGTNSYMASFSSTLVPIMAPLETLAATTIVNITASAQNGTCQAFFEVVNSYSYDSTIPTNFVRSVSVASGSITVASYVVLRSVGLASKSYIYNGVVYFLAAYQSPYQPTYFLVNGSVSTSASPNIIAKLAYGNGGGYSTYILSSVPQSGNTMYFGYLFKDLLEAANKSTNVSAGTQTSGIYTQTGINMATVTFQSSTVDIEEIANDVHISGGFLWMYDGYLPVEHNFFLWPDSVEVAQVDSVTPTGTITHFSNVITSITTTDIAIGMIISGTGIPLDTIVTGVNASANTVTMSAAAGGSGTYTFTFVGNADYTATYYYQVTYEWSDNQGNIFRSAPSIPVTLTLGSQGQSALINVPTLRCTMKTANPVKIVIYRWSSAQEEYYQVTSITGPLLNDTTIDSVSFIDPFADAPASAGGSFPPNILGNNLLYTTGGVVEDVNAPASNLFTLFDTRLWLVDAEDPNTVWYSKQVLEATPVEMSDLFTLYVPPSVGTSLNTGPITAIATMDDKLIIGKATSWVYINGIGPDNTGANSQYSQPIFVTSTVGCSNQASIVLSPTGLMFQSPSKGIRLMGRDLGVTYIGAPVESYVLGNTVTSAELMPGSTQVRFTMNTGVTLMYDYYYGQWATFNVNAESSCVFQGLHTYIDASQNVWQENPGSYLDGTTPVVMSFQTAPIRLGELDNYQRMYFFYLLGTYYSPHFLNLALTYDYGQSPSQTITIEPGTQVGITPGSLEAWRIFPMTQRCRAISLTLTESYDATLGPTAGQGLTLSGLNFVCGFKKPFVPTSSANSAG